MQITVIGAANVDIITKSKAKVVREDINPADVKLSAGGVGLNIAAMLARHGEDVGLITAVGKDPLGSILHKSCKEIGIKTDAWIIKSNTSTGVFLATLENDGEVYAAFNAMTAPETIRTAEITKHKGIVKDADLLILDLNISEKIINVVLDIRENRPVLVDAVSVAKVLRIENHLEKIDVLRLNRMEAECLTGITLDTKERVKQACFNIVNRGVTRVFITLGMAGVCAAYKKSAIFVPATPIVTKDLKGAGAAFTAGLALHFEDDLRTQAEAGIKHAAEHLERNS